MRPAHVPSRCLLFLSLCTVACVFLPTCADAQRLNGPPFPTPVLLVVSPCGGRVGTTFEIALSGLKLDDPTGLVFSQPGIQAERIAEPKPPAQPQPNRNRRRPPRRGQRGQTVNVRYRVTIAADAPLGIHDVRLINKWGVSNPRAFVVGDLSEAAEKEPNNNVSQAQRVALDSTVNGVISDRTDVDYYVFTGKKGQRIVLSCLASSIDSRLQAALDLYDKEGHWLGENRGYQGHDDLLDCTLPHDGDYYVRVFQFAYTEGSPQHYYRLSISTAPWIDAIYPSVVEPGSVARLTVYGRNLAGGQLDPSASVDGRVLERKTVTVQVPKEPAALSRLAYTGRIRPVQSALRGFEYRLHNAAGASNPYLLVFGTAPVVVDEDNNASADLAQRVHVPCEIAGRIDKRPGHHWYTFEAKRGSAIWIEVYGDRLGSQADMYFLVRDARTGRNFGEFDDTRETLSTNKFYTRDTDPPAYRFVAPRDGSYQLLVASRDAEALADVRQLFRVRLTPAMPDFQLVAMGPSNSNAEGCNLGQGGDQYLDVFAWRRDGWKGPIELKAEGLPAGVTCASQVLGPSMRHTALVLHAASDAKPWTGPIRVVGSATIGNELISRTARAASITWPVRPDSNVPLVSRLDRQLFLAVGDRPPFRLTASIDHNTVTQGERAKVTLKLTRLWPDFKGPVQVFPVEEAPQRAMLPNSVVVNNNNQPFSLAADKTDGTLTLTVRQNAQAGTFNIVLRGQAQVALPQDSRARRRVNPVVTLPATPITLTIVPRQVVRVSLSTSNLTVKSGKTANLLVRVSRLNDYDGPLEITITPRKQTDVRIEPATVPANQNQARLKVRAVADAHVGTRASFTVRVTAQVSGHTLTQNAKVNVTVVK